MSKCVRQKERERHAFAPSHSNLVGVANPPDPQHSSRTLSFIDRLQHNLEVTLLLLLLVTSITILSLFNCQMQFPSCSRGSIDLETVKMGGSGGVFRGDDICWPYAMMMAAIVI